MDARAPGADGAPDGTFQSLEKLYEFLGGTKIDWYPPTDAVLAVDRMRTARAEDSP